MALLEKRIRVANIPLPRPGNLRIATWNVREFGKGARLDESLEMIAAVLGAFDRCRSSSSAMTCATSVGEGLGRSLGIDDAYAIIGREHDERATDVRMRHAVVVPVEADVRRLAGRHPRRAPRPESHRRAVR